MPKSDTQIDVSTDLNIQIKKNPKSKALRAAIITGNNKKYEEFKEQLGTGYGLELTQFAANDDALEKQCLSIMENCEHSPHFILREETKLLSRDKDEDLTQLPLDDLAKRSLENVTHQSILTVYKPQWTELNGTKVLSGFSQRVYEKSSDGYISQDSNYLCKQGFGWDALFVNSATNLTNEAFFERYGKQSARQQVISDFIVTYLRYKSMITLKFHQLPVGENAIEFGEKYISIPSFIASDENFSNPFINDWFIQSLRNAMISEGMFFKGAFSRAVKNYFSPPLSGLPLTAKKDDVEETVFMTHDMLHYLVQDLICDMPKEKDSYYVYAAWRMTSEACTLVLADMLYADGLIKSGAPRSGVDSRIYPLFEMVKKVQQIPHPDALDKADKISLIKELLMANVHYALLGDESYWRALLTKENEREPSVEALNALKAYTNHFGKFFIGDNAWTKANYESMHSNQRAIFQWINEIGKDTFRQSNIPLLSDVTKALRQKSVSFNEYPSIVDAVFNYVFENKIEPYLTEDALSLDDEALIQSKAFRRFLIGQASIFSRYPSPLNCEHLKADVYNRLKDERAFSKDEQQLYRHKLSQFINGVMGLGLMSMAEAKNAKDCSPVFPPVYISYPKMQEHYGDIASCIRENILNYGNSMTKDSTQALDNPYVKVIKGITFIDVTALEEAIDTTQPVESYLCQKMIKAGVVFWDEEKNIIKTPVVGLSSIGSFSVCLSEDLPEGMIKLRMGKTRLGPISVDDLADGLRETMGMQSAHTYMNPKGKPAKALYDVTVEHGHFSIAHGASLGVTAFGLSKKVELELNAQRDVVHLARLTSARAACQKSPCLVAMTEQGARVSQNLLEASKETVENLSKEGSTLDWLEERNAMYPLSAAQSIGINATCRNFQKLVKDIAGSGKEKEYRNLLALLNDSLHAFLPECYPSTKSYHHHYPSEWQQTKNEVGLTNNKAAFDLFKTQNPQQSPEFSSLQIATVQDDTVVALGDESLKQLP